MKTYMRSAAVTAALVAAASFGTTKSQAAFLGTADLNYAGSPVYCSGTCISSGQSAGTVTVTASGGNLFFDVDLATGFTFQNNHNTTFAFGLDVTGAAISIQTTDTGNNGGETWTTQTSVNAGDGVTNNNNPPANTIWPYGLAASAANSSSDLEFEVSKTGTTLTLADITQTFDKNGVALWFIADVGNANGSTGYVGANQSRITTSQGTTPLPAALPLMGSVLGFGYLVGWRRKRRAAVAA